MLGIGVSSWPRRTLTRQRMRRVGISGAKIKAIIEGLNGARSENMLSRILVRFIGDDIFRKSWNSAAFVNKPTELGPLYFGLLSE